MANRNNIRASDVYDHGNSNSFLHMTGLTRSAFRSLLDYLFDLDAIVRRRRRGRPRSLGPDGELGLLLFYLGSTMTVKHLCLIFGVVPSVCRQVIHSMVKKAVKLLRSHPMARVAFPNKATMSVFANMVQQCKPSVNDIIGFMDGVSFPVECLYVNGPGGRKITIWGLPIETEFVLIW